MQRKHSSRLVLSRTSASQRGSLLFDILVGAAILSVIVIGAIVITNQRAAASEQSRAVRIIAEQVPAALTNIFYNEQRSYVRLAAGTSNDPADLGGTDILVNEGVEATMPWADGWTISTAGDGTPTVQITFSCANARNEAQMCRNLEASIGNILDPNNPNANRVLTAVALDDEDDPTAVLVTYGRPL